MSFSAWAYILFTVALGVVFAGIIAHYYSRKRRDAVEAPKYRIFSDDPEPTEPNGTVRRRER